MTVFQYHPAILAAYPNLVGGVILGSGLHNGLSPEALSAAYQSEQQAVIARIGSTPHSEIPSLSAWRGYKSDKVPDGCFERRRCDG